MTQAGPLHQEHPIEYPEGTPPLGENEAEALDTHLDHGWQRDGTRQLSREFTFNDFRDAFGFATRVALLAEREFHHPELTVTWGRVSLRSGPTPSRACPATTSSSRQRSTGSHSPPCPSSVIDRDPRPI